MPRARRPNALEDLTRAALAVFARDGFRGAQMVDVAREMGVALGTVYSYVESKDALFALAVGSALPGAPQVGEGDELPVRGPTADELLDLTRR
ncbi:MAG: helix-turn-helix transcriptional regulator, partial [Actinobacteria bacterium]|nr:helix-turn-helix transcriptional regulator [Actinomycetota bacterium]